MPNRRSAHSSGVRFIPMAEGRELLLLIPSRTLGFNGGDLLGYFAFDTGDGGFLKIRNRDGFFSRGNGSSLLC